MNEFEMNCSISGDKNAKTDIYLLHGFTRMPLSQIPLIALIKPGYRIIQCTARGHGFRSGNKYDWRGTIQEYDRFIRKNKRPVILIGHSMGGTEALTLGAINPYVKQVFAVSALNGRNYFYDHSKNEQELALHPKSEIRYGSTHMLTVLPERFLRCDPQNRRKFFLIHAKNDTRVPFSQFQANKKALCLPARNTKVLYNLPTSMDLSHSLAIYSSEALRFINRNLKEP